MFHNSSTSDSSEKLSSERGDGTATRSPLHHRRRTATRNYLLRRVPDIPAGTVTFLVAVLLVIGAVQSTPLRTAPEFDLTSIINNPCSRETKIRRHITPSNALQDQLNINKNHLKSIFEKMEPVSGTFSGSSLKSKFADMVQHKNRNDTYIVYYKSFVIHYVQLEYLRNMTVIENDPSFDYKGRRASLAEVAAFVRQALCSIFAEKGSESLLTTNVSETQITRFIRKNIVKYYKKSDLTDIKKKDTEVLEISMFLHDSLITDCIEMKFFYLLAKDNFKIYNRLNRLSLEAPQRRINPRRIARKLRSFQRELKCISHTIDNNIMVGPRSKQPKKYMAMMQKWTDSLLSKVAPKKAFNFARFNERQCRRLIAKSRENKIIISTLLRRFYKLLKLSQQNLNRRFHHL